MKHFQLTSNILQKCVKKNPSPQQQICLYNAEAGVLQALTSGTWLIKINILCLILN